MHLEENKIICFFYQNRIGKKEKGANFLSEIAPFIF